MPTEQEMKQEAIHRMQMLKMSKSCIDAFENDEIWSSQNHAGILYTLNADQRKIVEDFEKKSKSKVYHVIISYSNIGLLFDMLLVSAYEEDWEAERTDLINQCSCVMCKNLTDDDLSEMGGIRIAPINGGLKRLFP